MGCLVAAGAEQGLPKPDKAMTIDTVQAVALQGFATVAQPALRKLIATQLGAHGVIRLQPDAARHRRGVTTSEKDR
jgi:hypothetical protein